MTLRQIGSEMAVQNNRSTQCPMFAIMVDEKVYMPNAFGWDLKRERKEDVDLNDLCSNCVALQDLDEPIPDQCDDCDDESFDYFRVEERLAVELTGVFFTAKAAQDHIDRNRYHYLNPRVYGIGTWRNPEMQQVQRHLLSLRYNPLTRLFKTALPRHYR